MKSKLLCSWLLLAFHALLSVSAQNCYTCADDASTGNTCRGLSVTTSASSSAPCYIELKDSFIKRDKCSNPDCIGIFNAADGAMRYSCNSELCNDATKTLPASVTLRSCVWCNYGGNGCDPGGTERENGIICYMAHDQFTFDMGSMSTVLDRYYRGACMTTDCSDKKLNTYMEFVACSTADDCNNVAQSNTAAFAKISCYVCLAGNCPATSSYTIDDFTQNRLSVNGNGVACIVGLTTGTSQLQLDSCNNADCSDKTSSYQSNAYKCTDYLCNKKVAEDFTTTAEPTTTQEPTTTTQEATTTTQEPTTTTQEPTTTTQESTTTTQEATTTTQEPTTTTQEATTTTQEATTTTTPLSTTGATSLAQSTTNAQENSGLVDSTTQGQTQMDSSSVKVAVSGVLNTVIEICVVMAVGQLALMMQ